MWYASGMSEPNGNGGSTLPPATDQASSGGTDQNDGGGLDGLSSSDLVGIIKELRAENAGRRSKLKEYETAQSAAAMKAEEERQAQLAEQGKYKQLAEEHGSKLTAAESRATELEAALAANFKTQVDAYPEALRGLIPESMGLLEKMTYINSPAFQQLLQANGSKPPAPGGGSPGGSESAQAAAKLAELKKRAEGSRQPHDVAAYQAAVSAAKQRAS